MKSCWILGIVVMVLAAGAVAPAEEEPMIRVRIVYSLGEVYLTPAKTIHIASTEDGTRMDDSMRFRITSDAEKVHVADAETGEVLLSDSLIVMVPDSPTDGVKIEKVPFGVGWWWESAEDRVYHARVEIRPGADNKPDIVVELPVEQYLRGVVPAEIGGNSPRDALRAQAVAARSETMTALTERQYAGPHYDICADVDCQVFSGSLKATEATDEAIRSTRGIILTFDGKPIPAYYASNCGGYSEDVANVWPNRDRGIPCWSARFDSDEPEPATLRDDANLREFLANPPAGFCNPATSPDIPSWSKAHFRWEVTTSAEDLTALVAKRGEIGRVTRIEPLERGVSGRLIRVRFHGTEGTLDVGPELAIRQVWDPPLRSAAFVVDTAGDDPAAPESFTMRGAGYGHGVGMCQTGAIARAQVGQDFSQILTHYYKDAELVQVYE